jgi:hypothetical protein
MEYNQEVILYFFILIQINCFYQYGRSLNDSLFTLAHLLPDDY